MTDFTRRELRDAFGTFMTGVTVVTTVQPDGTPRGFTANSFTSVSLDPPLLLICIAKSAGSFEVFDSARGFAVNVLSEDQKDISNCFASKQSDRFSSVAWAAGPAGNPVFAGASAWFDCDLRQRVDAGDHVVLIGEVRGLASSELNGLGYVRGGYFTLGSEQEALSAVATHSHLVVGAIVERSSSVLLVPDAASGGLRLPAVGLGRRGGSLDQLKSELSSLGLTAKIASIYSVYENRQSGVHYLYYRATAHEGRPNEGAYYPVNALPFDNLQDEATRIMMQRFAEEHTTDSFGVYLGSEQEGELHIRTGGIGR